MLDGWTSLALYIPEHDEQPFLVEVLGRYTGKGFDEVRVRPLMGGGRAFWAPAARVRVMLSKWVRVLDPKQVWRRSEGG